MLPWAHAWHTRGHPLTERWLHPVDHADIALQRAEPRIVTELSGDDFAIAVVVEGAEDHGGLQLLHQIIAAVLDRLVLEPEAHEGEQHLFRSLFAESDVDLRVRVRRRGNTTR